MQDFADHHEATAQIRLQCAGLEVLSLAARNGADEFMRHPRLAEAGIAEDDNRLALAIARIVPGLVQHLHLHFATDERRQLPFGAQMPTRAPPVYPGHVV